MQNALAGPGDALGKLTDTFRNRISELHIATGLRISGDGPLLGLLRRNTSTYALLNSDRRRRQHCKACT